MRQGNDVVESLRCCITVGHTTFFDGLRMILIGFGHKKLKGTELPASCMLIYGINGEFDL